MSPLIHLMIARSSNVVRFPLEDRIASPGRPRAAGESPVIVILPVIRAGHYAAKPVVIPIRTADQPEQVS